MTGTSDGYEQTFYFTGDAKIVHHDGSETPIKEMTFMFSDQHHVRDPGTGEMVYMGKPRRLRVVYG